MKTKKHQSLNSHKVGFWKTNWALLVLIFLAFIVIFALCYVVLAPYWNKKSLEKDIANIKITSDISVNKIVCYSSAYGINNSETQARWNLNLSQFTDIAIYLNVQTDITNMHIDNISFSNQDIGNLSLSYLSAESFAKSPIADLELTEQNNNDENNSNNAVSTSDNIMATPDKISLDLALPITLRYLNNNFKENCLITDIETPLSFDGSILKRAKVTLSSLKNTISFSLHITDDSNQEFVYPIIIPINLENSEKEQSIYDGSYTEDINFSNAYFYKMKNI